MTPTRRIRRPDAEADHPRPWALASVFALAVVLGLLVVRPTLRQPRRPPPSEPAVTPADLAPEVAAPEPETASGAGAPRDPEDAPRGPAEPAAPLAPPSPPVPAPATQVPAPAPPAPSPRTLVVSTPGSHRTVLPGRLAYLQCAGLERPGRPFPCPRDPALEAAAWEILMALPRCPEVDVGAGAADVRLHFGLEGSPEIEYRRVPGEPPLSAEGLRACSGDALGALRTQLRSTRMVLSLRLRTR